MVLVLIALFVCGCGGDGRIKARGRLLKNGQPFPLGEGEGMRMFFVPTTAEGTTYDSYVAVYDKTDGSFKVTGKDGKGLPPGQYRVALEHMKKKQDLFKGAYSAKRTPIVREVSSNSGEIIIDLDKPAS
jgi:hypothetical protein